jgi:Tol biopolymer transport system component
MRPPRCRVLIASVALTAALAAGGGVAAARDQIAYRCDVDICIVDPDAPGAVTNLTDNGTTSLDGDPAWSPDGKRVAFVSTFGGGGRNLFVMEPDAPGQAVNLATQLTFYPNDSAVLAAPVWSRDGTRVAYQRNASPGAPDGVFVVNGDGTTATPTTVAATGTHPTWSPDGTKIAFSRDEQVYAANADGSGSPTPLANGAGHDPVWSPDGTEIAFDGISPAGHAPFVDLHVVSAGGGGTPVVIPINFSQWTFAAWSPDATKLAYRSTADNNGYPRIVGADGSGDRSVAAAPNVNDYEPTWSPEGARVAFHGYRYDPVDPSVADNEIYVASATDGSGAQHAVTTGDKNYEPAWRPDPLRGPVVPILNPGGGTSAPATPGGPISGGGGPSTPANPGPASSPPRKPTVVWITKRVPYSPGLPIFVGSVGCGGITCAVVTSANATAAQPILPGHAFAAKAKKKPKAKSILIARGRLQVPAGATRRVLLTVTRAGAAFLRRHGTITVTVTMTTTAAGQPKSITTKKLRVSYTKNGKR